MKPKISVISKPALLLLTMILVTSGCKKATETTNLKLGHGLDMTHPVHKGMEYMAKRVSELSDGQLKIDIYPSEQLGSERECLEMLQIGSLAMTKVSSAVMESFVPEFQVFGLPYLFRNSKHAHKVMDGPIGKKILNSGTEYWLKGLAFYDAGSRSFYTVDKPIRKPSDLEGMKIRVQESIMSVRMVRAMGGSPTPISWGELYTALQNQVVDGAENNLPSFHLSYHFEICNYLSMDEHTTLPDVLLISTHVWEELSKKEQEWLRQAARESVEKQREYWQEARKEALKTIQKEGVEVIYPDKEPFRESVQSVYDYFKENNPEVYSIAEQIQNVEVSDSKKTEDQTKR
ncbi:MAG: TRAP transporter substrate-binding protein [Bacteroidales bacterium]|nr:TRAP transporter substrate-binding protein [Bacteroidales bacterium]